MNGNPGQPVPPPGGLNISVQIVRGPNGKPAPALNISGRVLAMPPEVGMQVGAALLGNSAKCLAPEEELKQLLSMSSNIIIAPPGAIG